MDIFGQPHFDTLTEPSYKVGALRHDLIVEEVNELIEAIRDDNIVEIADALADILYVTYGALATFGLKDELTILTDNIQEQMDKTKKLSQDNNLLKVSDAQDIIDNYNNFKEVLWYNLSKGHMRSLGGYMRGIITMTYCTSKSLGIDIESCFYEVHASNMSKVCSTLEEANDSLNVRYHDEGLEDYRDAWIDEINGYFVIKRKSDDKVLKGCSYFVPDLQKILNKA